MTVDVNIHIFDTEKYKYGKSKHSEIIETNKITLTNLIKSIFIEHDIIDESMNIDVVEIFELIILYK